MQTLRIHRWLARRASSGLAIGALALGLAAMAFTPGSAHAVGGPKPAQPDPVAFRPDLVPVFSTSGTAQSGGPVGFYGGVNNQGNGAASPVSMVIWIPDDMTNVSIDPGQFSCSKSGSYITCTLPSLARHELRAVIVKGTAPVASGTYNVVVKVDQKEQVVESDEINNLTVNRLASY